MFNAKRQVDTSSEVEYFGSSPPNPSPREFGESLIRMESERVRIHEESDSHLFVQGKISNFVKIRFEIVL